MADTRAEKQLQASFEKADLQRRESKDQLDRERLTRISGDVVRTITDPGFVEKMRVARMGADQGQGLDAAAELLSLEGLRNAGVDIPEDFRLTSRVFEDRSDGFRIQIDPGRGPIDIGDMAPQWGACAGGGGLTFCGCGGFST